MSPSLFLSGDSKEEFISLFLQVRDRIQVHVSSELSCLSPSWLFAEGWSSLYTLPAFFLSRPFFPPSVSTMVDSISQAFLFCRCLYLPSISTMVDSISHKFSLCRCLHLPLVSTMVDNRITSFTAVRAFPL